MSCFKGLMREYTNVSIDRFDGQNVSSTVFFLSHCHRDHMVGLEWPAFQQRLQSRNNVFLYCSAVTKTLLLADVLYQPLEKYIKVLPVNTPTTVIIPDKGCDERKASSVLVTALSAGHCPGSFMFLFEGKEGNVLYTGDFRWETNYAQSLQAFKSGNSVKEVKSLYIDTTFCFEDAFHFPSRTDCEEAASDLVRKWLRQSEDHIVSISCKAKYGYEHLLQEISAKTGEKVHTSPHKCDIYQQIGELRHVFTTNPSAKIHMCDFRPGRSPLSKLPCGYVPDHGRDLQVLVLRPSTMFFALQNHQLRQKDLIFYPKGPCGLHRVCYSFHSSYVEIRDLVMFLRPQRVFPNVRPPNEEDMSKVQTRLNGFLKLVHLNHIPSHVAPSNILGKLKVRRRENQAPQWSQSDSEGLVFDSTPVKHKPDTEQETASMENPLKNSEKYLTDGTPTRGDISNTDSSYQGSNIDNEEMDLTKSEGDGQPDAQLLTQDLLECQEGGGDMELKNNDSYCLYVSGDEDCDEEDRLSADIYPDNDDIIVIESSYSQDNTESFQQLMDGDHASSDMNVACDSERKQVQDVDMNISEPGSLTEGMVGGSEVINNPGHANLDDTVSSSVRNSSDVESVSNLSSDKKDCDISGDKSKGCLQMNTETDKLSDKKHCDNNKDKSDEPRTQNNRNISDESGGSTEKSASHYRDKETGDLVGVDCVVIQDSRSPSSEWSKSKSRETNSSSSSNQISSPVTRTYQRGQKQFQKTGSFDLFDEGNVTDIEDNVIEENKDSQGFDVDLGSSTSVADSCARRRKYITEIDKQQEMNIREATAQMLLRLQRGYPAPPPPGEQIVISDSDSDTESGFLSGSKDSEARRLQSNQSDNYSRNLSALVSKVEKRLASSDSEFTPRKRLRLDISRNCESDSDITLPPSQGSHGSMLQSGLYYDSTDTTESDTDSDAVEILFQTDPSGARYDVLGNPVKSGPDPNVTKSEGCPVKPVLSSPVEHSTAESSDVIDLTEDNEDSEDSEDK